jgi:hypothetical protein
MWGKLGKYGAVFFENSFKIWGSLAFKFLKAVFLKNLSVSFFSQDNP